MSNTVTRFEAQPKQQQLIEAGLSGDYDTLFFGGGLGGGKTRGLCALFIILSRLWPGNRSVIIRESMPSLKRTTIPSFEAIVPQGFLQKFNRSELTATFTNGSQILFMEESFSRDPEMNRFKGLEVNQIGFDQVEEIQEKVYRFCHTRKARWRMPEWKTQPPSFVASTCNPIDNWLREEFYVKYRAGTLPKRTIFIEALVSDNPVLYNDINYMSGFDHLDPLTKAQMLSGDWDAFAVDNAFMYSFDRDKHIGRTMPVYQDMPLILSFDFNVEPMTCLVAQAGESFIWVHEEIQVNPRAADMHSEICREIATKYPGMFYIVTGDASGRNRSPHSHRNSYEAIQKYLGLNDNQIRVRRQNLSLKDSRVLCNSVLHSFPFRVHERCKTLISECKSAVFLNGKLQKNRKDKKLDSLDACRYLVDYCLPDFLEFLKPETTFGHTQEIND